MVRLALGDTGPVNTNEAVSVGSNELRILDNPAEHRYEARVGDAVAGFSEYRLRPDRIAFVHTVVEPTFAGQGVGSRLARGLLDDVRSRGLKVTPYCEFIAGFIQRHPEYEDMVSWGPRGAKPTT